MSETLNGMLKRTRIVKDKNGKFYLAIKEKNSNGFTEFKRELSEEEIRSCTYFGVQHMLEKGITCLKGKEKGVRFEWKK